MTTVADIEEMIARCATGDRSAFSGLYQATSAKLFGVLLRILNNRTEAEDALQEVYVKVWKGAALYRANGLSPMTWLITIARNHGIDRLRARKSPTRDIDDVVDLADLGAGPEAQMIAASEAGRIARCMGTLDPDRAEAVRRAYLGGEAYADLASRFGVPLNTVRTWLRRSLIKLRECLSDDG